MKRCLMFAILLFAASASALPQIVSIDGSLADGNSITITGTSFGNASLPDIFETFEYEGASDGDDLGAHDAEWIDYRQGGADLSNDFARSGNFSANNDLPDNDSPETDDFATSYYQHPQRLETYVTYWFRIDDVVVGNPGMRTNVKITRSTSSAEAGGGGVYHGEGTTSISGLDAGSADDGYFYYNNGEGTVYPEPNYRFDNAVYNDWFRVEMASRLSDPPGTANGYAYGKYVTLADDEDSHKFYENQVTRAAGYDFLKDTIILGLMEGRVDGDMCDLYIDDVYISSTRARVEISRTDNFTTSTYREIQPFTSWNSTSVTFHLNQAEFQEGDTAYLFVVDENGSVSEPYSITISSESYHEADTDEDGFIDTQEIREYISRWKAGSASLDLLFSGISIWKAE